MEKVICDLCGKQQAGYEKVRFYFGHKFCDGCVGGLKEYIQVLVDIAEQERRRNKRPTIIVTNDMESYIRIKDGKTDIIRTEKEYEQGIIIDLHYEGFAFKDRMECKVCGCHKSVSGGYILELIKL